jgi:lipoprotein signal peptidase
LAYDGYESVGCVFVVEEDRKQEVVVDGHWLRWLLASNRGVAHSIRS